MVDLSKIPLVALSLDTKTVISTLLNPRKWLPTDDGLPRDWRGLAHLCEISGEQIPSLASHSDPTEHLLSIVAKKKPSVTLDELEALLSKLDRFDIIDDARSLLERDAEQYLERLERCENPAAIADTETEKMILTMDDCYRVKCGMNNQCYDAFVLYAEEDFDFVKEMIEILENKHRLKLCLKDRDLMGGIPFEHEAVMRLISERCNRLIVVISPDFLKSSANTFFLNYAQAVGIGSGQRKIIPCLYKKCPLPPQLAYQFILDYSKNGLYDFWGRLHACVQVIAQDRSAKSPLPTENSSHRSNDEKIIENAKICDPMTKSVSFTEATGDSVEKNYVPPCQPVTQGKSVKAKRTKLLPWSNKKRVKNPKITGDEKEPITESISITVSLPSLNELPSLDTIEPTLSQKSTKRRKNLVGTCVKKVQSLLSKQ